MIGTILKNVDGIKLGVDFGTELASLDEPFHNTNYGKLEGLLFGDSLGSNNGKVLGSDEGIKLRFFYCKVISTILVNIDGIRPGLDFGTELIFLDVFLYDSYDDTVEGFLFGDS